MIKVYLKMNWNAGDQRASIDSGEVVLTTASAVFVHVYTLWTACITR